MPGKPLEIQQIAIADLAHDPANARKHDDKNLKAIEASLRRFGQQKPIVVDKSGVVRAGNGTLAAAEHLGWETVACVITDLEGSEATAYAIADNRTAELAEWDEDVLAAQLNGLLQESEGLFSSAGFDTVDLEALIDDLEDTSEEEGVGQYTTRIESPIYEPTLDEPPEVSQLYDASAAAVIKALIDDTEDLPDDVRTFLLFSAYRHVKFDYENIAEFYAHASASVQRIMEASALIIVDFDQAIENGWVGMSKEISDLYRQDYNESEGSDNEE